MFGVRKSISNAEFDSIPLFYAHFGTWECAVCLASWLQKSIRWHRCHATVAESLPVFWLTYPENWTLCFWNSINLKKMRLGPGWWHWCSYENCFSFPTINICPHLISPIEKSSVIYSICKFYWNATKNKEMRVVIYLLSIQYWTALQLVNIVQMCINVEHWNRSQEHSLRMQVCSIFFTRLHSDCNCILSALP